MANGSYEGLTLGDPKFRALFAREALLASDWYRERLRTKQRRDIALWKRHLESLESLPARPRELDARFDEARRQMARVSSPAYLEELVGTIGADTFYLQIPTHS